MTLDLKCLYLLIEKPSDENFVLAGSGLEIEFCFLCHALRVLEDILVLIDILLANRLPARLEKNSASEASGSQSVVTRFIPFALDCTRLSPTGACSQANYFSFGL